MPETLNVNALFTDVADVVRKSAKLRLNLAIEPDSRLVEDLGIDSLDLVGVFLQIQDHFDILIEDEDLLKLRGYAILSNTSARHPAAAA